MKVADLKNPYGMRDDGVLLAELEDLTRHHLRGCAPYRLIWPNWKTTSTFAELPYLHAGLFKQMAFRTDAPGIKHERTLKSSATTSGTSSLITLDNQSSALQSQSTLEILRDFIGEKRRPLLILDNSRSLIVRGEVSARVAAAMSLRPLASEIHFLLDSGSEPESMKWDVLASLLSRHDELLVYGFTWMLWLAWAAAKWPSGVRDAVAGKRITFVHSGGWKKLEALNVAKADFDGKLMTGTSVGSKVVDYYGLVEQVGVIYPLCESGYRHVPRWAEIIVRDPWTLDPLDDKAGQLQLLNPLALGAPYHSVLTEDMGLIVSGSCKCGRQGRRFKLVGRIPKTEIRGCANV